MWVLSCPTGSSSPCLITSLFSPQRPDEPGVVLSHPFHRFPTTDLLFWEICGKPPLIQAPAEAPAAHPPSPSLTCLKKRPASALRESARGSHSTGGVAQPQTARLLWQSRLGEPLCGWFLRLGAVSRMEVAPLSFHNSCRNSHWPRQGKGLAPLAAHQAACKETPAGLRAQEELAPASPALNQRDCLVALPLGKCQALQSLAQKVKFLFEGVKPMARSLAWLKLFISLKQLW